MYPESSKHLIRESMEQRTEGKPQSESKAVLALRANIAELEQTVCAMCSSKKCGISCETWRKIDTYQALINGRGWHGKC